MYDNSLSPLQSFLGSKAFFFKIFVGLHSDDADLFGNGSGCGRLIASNHDDLDTGRLAFLDGERHTFFGRIHEGNKSDKDVVFEWEVEVIRSRGDELIVLMVDLFIEGKHGKAKHSLSIFAEPQVDSFKFLLGFSIDLVIFSLIQDSSTIFPYLFRSSLDVGDKVMVRSLLLHDRQGILVSGVKRHLRLGAIFTDSIRIVRSGFNNVLDWLIEFD